MGKLAVDPVSSDIKSDLKAHSGEVIATPAVYSTEPSEPKRPPDKFPIKKELRPNGLSSFHRMFNIIQHTGSPVF